MQKKKLILLVSAFGNINKSSNSRLSNLYSSISAHNEVKFITTNFDHSLKKAKPRADKCHAEILLDVPAYKHNISVLRIVSHIVFAIRLLKLLKRLPRKPDLIYCTMPTTLAAFVSGMYCKFYGIPFVVDVIDLWPESLYPLSKYSFLLSLACYPWRLLSQKSYSLADLLIAESKHYLHTASKFNSYATKDFFYLGVDRKRTRALLESSKLLLAKPSDEIWVCYGGQLGNSYDFDTLLEAVKFIHDIGIKYKFWFVGDGEMRSKIENYAKKFQLNVHITGLVSYADFLKFLSYCDIGINIFKKNTKVVHSYKFNDYVATKLFILNSLPGETSEVIDQYKIGLNFNFSSNKLASVLCEVCQNWKFYKCWVENCDKLIAEVLDSTMIYSKMTQQINSLLERQKRAK